MKRDTFNLGFATLLNAFSYAADRLSPETQEIYWQDLKDIPDKRFQAGVDWCRHHSEFFPSIAKLGAACFAGNENWHEDIVKHKRLEFQRRMKQIAPPMREEQRRENQRRVAEIANSLGKKLDANK